MTDEKLIRERLSLLPPIRRARLWRLYSEARISGRPRRYLDLWMDGGRALLGAKGTGIGTAAKAAIDTGLLRPMPSIWERRLKQELRRAYPDYAEARVFLSDERALAAVGKTTFYDPARRGAEPREGAVVIIRPFGEHLGPEPKKPAPIALPLLPCPSALSPSILLFRDRKLASSVAGDILPPLRLSAAHRALCELVRMREWYGEELWKKVDRRLGFFFERRGPYLFLRETKADYDAVFKAALQAGVLLPPDPELPSIIPGDFDDGELAALARALA